MRPAGEWQNYRLYKLAFRYNMIFFYTSPLVIGVTTVALVVWLIPFIHDDTLLYLLLFGLGVAVTAYWINELYAAVLELIKQWHCRRVWREIKEKEYECGETTQFHSDSET